MSQQRRELGHYRDAEKSDDDESSELGHYRGAEKDDDEVSLGSDEATQRANGAEMIENTEIEEEEEEKMYESERQDDNGGDDSGTESNSSRRTPPSVVRPSQDRSMQTQTAATFTKVMHPVNVATVLGEAPKAAANVAAPPKKRKTATKPLTGSTSMSNVAEDGRQSKRTVAYALSQMAEMRGELEKLIAALANEVRSGKSTMLTAKLQIETVQNKIKRQDEEIGKLREEIKELRRANVEVPCLSPAPNPTAPRRPSPPAPILGKRHREDEHTVSDGAQTALPPNHKPSLQDRLNVPRVADPQSRRLPLEDRLSDSARPAPMFLPPRVPTQPRNPSGTAAGPSRRPFEKQSVPTRDPARPVNPIRVHDRSVAHERSSQGGNKYGQTRDDLLAQLPPPLPPLRSGDLEIGSLMWGENSLQTFERFCDVIDQSRHGPAPRPSWVGKADQHGYAIVHYTRRSVAIQMSDIWRAWCRGTQYELTTAHLLE